MINKLAIKELIKRGIARKIREEKALRKLKAEIAAEFGVAIMPNVKILAVYRDLINSDRVKRSEQFWHLLTKRKIRNLSGVAVSTVLTKPYPCPGRCVYCPSERNMPKSYLANEPGAARAVRNKFDPYKQVVTRLRSLEENGHNTDKCELIVLGGTWSAYPKKYQNWFIKRCFDGFNKKTTRTIAQAKKINERAPHRVVGLTLETRPDFIDDMEIQRLRTLGCTRVQLGVQTLDDKVLKLVQRGHIVADVTRATRLLKEAGFKVSHHYMQNLPGADFNTDLQTMRLAFTSPDFQPDHIKLYPTSVIKSALLFEWWKKGKYAPYSLNKMTRLIGEIKKLIPEWVRIERIIRDIPSDSIVAGHSVTNLRQILMREGVQCRCIRCHEPREVKVNFKDVEMVRREYDASGGREIFLSYESRDRSTLYAFVRLRLQWLKKHWCQELIDAAIIREIHSYGRLAALAKLGKKGNVQHRGLGRQLMAEAEKIALEEGFNKMAVIAGVGVRDYFRKLGYKLKGNGEYMVKRLK